MSAESQSLERSVLERKDREHLQTLVSALGGKAPSRARKADLIDLVLELAGVTSGDATPASSDDSSTGDEGEPSGADAGQAPSGATGTARTDSGATGDGGADDGGSGPSQGRGGRRGRRGGGAGAAAARTDDDETESGEAGGGPQRSAPTSNGGATGAPAGQSTGSGEADPEDRASGDASGDEPEPANRRRRRRGRDRDRGDEQWQGEPVEVAGLLDLRDEGYGFLRLNGYLPSRDDVYVSVKQVRQFGLRKGDRVAGASRPASRNEKNPALLRIDTVNDVDAETGRERVRFDDLAAIHPAERLVLAGEDAAPDVRVLDLLTPLGRGQRALVTGPARSGTTTILQQLTEAVAAHHPEVEVLVLLVDERPEEVTGFAGAIERGEVVASTFDRPGDEHVAIAELVLERAKRLAEEGTDVFLIVDSLTALARAHQAQGSNGGRSAGGSDAVSAYPAKRFFGAARNLADAGSITMVAAAPSDSEADQRTIEELTRSANLVMVLDRRLADQKVFPAIDSSVSATRHEDALWPAELQTGLHALRSQVARRDAEDGPGGGLLWLLEQVDVHPDAPSLLAAVEADAP